MNNSKQIKIIKEIHPFIADAAKEAVFQWIYEPFILKGEPRPLIFEATVSFKLK